MEEGRRKKGLFITPKLRLSSCDMVDVSKCICDRLGFGWWCRNHISSGVTKKKKLFGWMHIAAVVVVVVVLGAMIILPCAGYTYFDSESSGFYY